MIYKIFLSWLLLIACSCNIRTKQKSTAKELEIFDLSKEFPKYNLKGFNLSEFYSKIDGFTLGNEANPIGHVSKVIIFDKILFVLDSHYAKKIFAFDLSKKGKFMFSIGTRGKGPGEFLRISDFSIDSLGRQLVIIDAMQSKISYFDLTGQFLTSKKTRFIPLKVFCGKTYLYFIKQAVKDKDFVIEVTDKKSNHVKEYLQKKNHPSFESYDTGFIKFKDNILLNYSNCDTIFQIKDLLIEPYLAINSGQYSLSSCVRLNHYNIKDFLNYSQEKNNHFGNIIFPGIYFEDDKLRSFEFRANKVVYYYLKSKSYNNGQTRIGYIINDIFESYITFIGYDNHYGTIGVINSRSMLNANLESTPNNKQIISDQLIQVLKHPDPNANPCIVFLK